MSNLNDNGNFYQEHDGFIYPNLNFCQNNNISVTGPVTHSTFPPSTSTNNADENYNMSSMEKESDLLFNYSTSNNQVHLSEEDISNVKQLLMNWNLSSIVDTCLKELIDISILKSMTQSQSEILLASFPLGIKMKFWNCLNAWQNTLNIDNSNQNEFQLDKNSINANSSNLSEKDNSSIHLSIILNDCPQGKLIVDFYKSKGKLNDECRTILVEIIIAYMIRYEKPMTIKIAQDISLQIISAFPTEIKEIYFIRGSTNTSPKGKLYAKYYNCLRSLKKGGLIKTSKRNYHSKSPPRSELELSYESETDIDDHLSSIRHNACSWPDLEVHWKATVKYRLNHIQTCDTTKTILDSWPNYKVPLGYKLIDIDFKFKFPQCENMLTNYDKIFDKLLSLIKMKVKDPASLKILTEMETADIDENGRNACVFYLIHSVLVPTSKKVIKDNNKRSLIKYSIKDSQTSFLIFAHTVEEIEEIISSLREKGDPIQPFVMIIGTILKPKEILVFFDYAKFKVFSVVRAVDICFKIIHLFHLKYPLQCIMVWHFVQKLFYKLDTPYDTVYPQVSKLISELN